MEKKLEELTYSIDNRASILHTLSLAKFLYISLSDVQTFLPPEQYQELANILKINYLKQYLSEQQYQELVDAGENGLEEAYARSSAAFDNPEFTPEFMEAAIEENILFKRLKICSDNKRGYMLISDDGIAMQIDPRQLDQTKLAKFVDGIIEEHGKNPEFFDCPPYGPSGEAILAALEIDLCGVRNLKAENNKTPLEQKNDALKAEEQREAALLKELETLEKGMENLKNE